MSTTQPGAGRESPARTRVLFIAEAVTLAHVGRAIRLASILHARGTEVILACDDRYRQFTRDLPFEVVHVHSIAADRFLSALARGSPVYSQADLLRYAADDLALMDSHGPAAVVGDFRLSLSASARRAGVPYVNITNAYWSRDATPVFDVPSLWVNRLLGVPVTRALFRAVRPLAFAAHATPLNRVRKAFGLEPLARDVRAAYCDGDLVLYADVPEMIPLSRAPASHRFIGPVLWSPPVARPAWWDAAVETSVAPIYVSMGSSGSAGLMPTIIEALMPLKRPLVVATANRGEVPSAPGVWTAPFLPGEAIAARACAVVCNGGSPTTQQALAHGVPVVGIAGNLDQFLNMHYVERFGAGILLRADTVRQADIRRAVSSVLDTDRVRARARTASELARATPCEERFPAAIATVIGPR